MKYVTFYDSLKSRAETLEKRAVWYEAVGNAYMAAEMRRRAANKRRLLESHKQFGAAHV